MDLITLSTILDPSTIDWVQAQAMLLELLNSGIAWLLASALTLGPILIGWFVRKVMDKLSGTNTSITTINRTVADNSALVNQLQGQQLQTQKLLVALITLSNLAPEKKDAMLQLVQDNQIDIQSMVQQAKDTAALDAVQAKVVEDATSLLQDLAKKVGV